MDQIIHTSVKERAAELAESFQNAPFFPHVQIDNFFDEAFCRRLLQQFPSFDLEAKDEIGHLGQKATREDVRGLGDAYEQIDDVLQQPEFLGLLSTITGVPNLLYDPDYVGGGTHDNVHGAELDVHVDFNYHPRKGWHRRLNLIVFLNEEWQREWGGCFEVHSDPWSEDDELRSFVPTWNSAVIFETNEHSWHGFDRVDLPADRRDLSRRSFAVYFYSQDRPEEQTAPSHASVYVPRPLPERFTAGYTLVDGDVLEIQKLLHRRSHHLRFLYEREKEASETIASIKRQLRALESSALGTLRLDGPIEQRGGVRGGWPDGWIGAEMDVRVKAKQSTSALVLDGVLPSPDGTPRRLHATWAGESFEIETAGPFSWRFEAPLAAGQESVLEIKADQIWQPSPSGSGGDERQLAFQFHRLSAEPA